MALSRLCRGRGGRRHLRLSKHRSGQTIAVDDRPARNHVCGVVVHFPQTGAEPEDRFASGDIPCRRHRQWYLECFLFLLLGLLLISLFSN